jgi:hypothetical protein
MSKSHLKIVKFHPNEYSLSEALFSDSNTTVATHGRIESALSLYFQWPESRSAVIYLNGSDRTCDCEISYDEDESEIEFIFIKLRDEFRQTDWITGQKVRVRFEIFRTCFEIESEILDTSNDPSERYQIVLGVPAEGMLYKHRRLKRYPVPSGVLETVKFQIQSGEVFLGEAIDISCNSVAVRGLSLGTGDVQGVLTWYGRSWRASVLRSTGDSTVIMLCPASGQESGAFFEIYRLVAYPYLRRRDEVKSDDVIDLYEKTGYVGRYINQEGENSLRKEILNAWEQLKAGAHDTVIDYVAIGKSTNLVGCSGLALSHFQDGNPVWFFNQLCAISDPDLLEHSGGLYLWRLDYLLVRPGELFASGRYRSKSRWLERIYTKFLIATRPVPELEPILTIQNRYYAKSNLNKKSQSFAAGGKTRYWADNKGLIGGILPEKYNISDSLDSVLAYKKRDDVENLPEFIENLLESANVSEMLVSASIHPDATPPEGSYIGHSDRIFKCQKRQLVDLASSIEHVLAVLCRKRMGAIS